MPKKISPASALIPLALWIENNSGIPPQPRDCRPVNGLPHYSTYIRDWDSFGAAVSAARSLMSCPGWKSAFSAASTRQCMSRCGEIIPDEGPSIRHCARCRSRLFRETEEIDEEPHAITIILRRHNRYIMAGNDLMDLEYM